MPHETFGDTVSGWNKLDTSLAANAADLPHLESRRVRLTELSRLAQELTNQQSALTASKQEVTRRLQEVLDEGRKIAAFLRAGVREHYGRRSEKLVEFGLRPFRGFRRPAETETPPNEKNGNGSASTPAGAES